MLELHFHPLASWCWKVLIALYENDTAFEPKNVDLMDPAQREALEGLWPFSKFPVLRDVGRERIVAESSIVIDYLTAYYPGPVELIPSDPELAREARLRDRIYDSYVHDPMNRIVANKLRPEEHRDAYGSARLKAELQKTYDILERKFVARPWALGERFSIADCAAAPALFYADKVSPIGPACPELSAYLDRLRQRPSFARVLREAEPYFEYFPGG
ncbi:MAG: glutathione S-transferase family protein [Myxococcota bacterium]|jgi:glutathione S-transferase|nr:glutathione S-transferase family protein [Myxococcota bacterium]